MLLFRQAALHTPAGELRASTLSIGDSPLPAVAAGCPVYYLYLSLSFLLYLSSLVYLLYLPRHFALLFRNRPSLHCRHPDGDWLLYQRYRGSI